MRKQLETNGGLMLAMLASGLLLGPVLGWWPLFGIGAACGTWVFIASQLKGRR